MYASSIITITHLYTAYGVLWRAEIRIITAQFTAIIINDLEL